MTINIDANTKNIDECIRLLRTRIPDAELYELGALMITSGAFLVVSAIPGLKDKFHDAVELSHQLLNQPNDAEANASSTGPLQ